MKWILSKSQFKGFNFCFECPLTVLRLTHQTAVGCHDVLSDWWWTMTTEPGPPLYTQGGRVQRLSQQSGHEPLVNPCHGPLDTAAKTINASGLLWLLRKLIIVGYRCFKTLYLGKFSLSHYLVPCKLELAKMLVREWLFRFSCRR